jgi:hypothetical protein
VDSTAAIAKAISQLDCDENVKSALKSLFTSQVGQSEQLPKAIFQRVIEEKYEAWDSQIVKNEESE